MSDKINNRNAPEEPLEPSNEASDNPTARDDISVTLSVPETVEIRMVEATALSDYELHFLFTSFFFSAFVGCGVAALQADEHTRVPWIVFTTILFFAFLGFLFWTLKKRTLLTSKRSRSLRYTREGPPKRRKPKQKVQNKAKNKKDAATENKQAEQMEELQEEAGENDEGKDESGD